MPHGGAVYGPSSGPARPRARRRTMFLGGVAGELVGAVIHNRGLVAQLHNALAALF